MHNRLNVVTTRMEEAEEQINHTEVKIMENNKVEKKKERKILDHECRLRELSDSIKCNNTCIIESQKKRRGERGRRFI